MNGRPERHGYDLFFEDWYRQTFLAGEKARTARSHFLTHWRDSDVRPNPLFDPRFLERQLGTAFSADPLGYVDRNRDRIDATCEWFSRRQYRALYPDVAHHWPGLPDTHFLQHGLREGRQPHPGFVVRRTDGRRPQPANRFQQVIYRFEWRDCRYEVLRSAMTVEITEQIRDQARHEIALFAPGDKAVAALRQVFASDLMARAGLDLNDLPCRAGDACETVVFLPWIQIGGGDRYAAELVREIREQDSSSRILVIISEWGEAETKRFAEYEFLAPLFQSRLLFWRDATLYRTQDAWLAALLMNRLRPRRIIVANSDLGHSMLAQYGVAISSFARCLPIFFSESPNAMGAPYSARYFADICRVSHTITDNDRMARTLRHRAAGLAGDSVFVLPPRIDIESDDVFTGRLRRRFLTLDAPWRNQCVWIGRVEPFKGTDILLAVARVRQDIMFDIFGPASPEMQAVLHGQRNVRYRGEFLTMDDIDFEKYEFLLFPSL
ncbi:MAG: hypothetical protein ABI224_00485, partial [Acetobacteraceae bacterium]